MGGCCSTDNKEGEGAGVTVSSAATATVTTGVNEKKTETVPAPAATTGYSSSNGGSNSTSSPTPPNPTTNNHETKKSPQQPSPSGNDQQQEHNHTTTVIRTNSWVARHNWVEPSQVPPPPPVQAGETIYIQSRLYGWETKVVPPPPVQAGETTASPGNSRRKEPGSPRHRRRPSKDTAEESFYDAMDSFPSSYGSYTYPPTEQSLSHNLFSSYKHPPMTSANTTTGMGSLTSSAGSAANDEAEDSLLTPENCSLLLTPSLRSSPVASSAFSSSAASKASTTPSVVPAIFESNSRVSSILQGLKDQQRTSVAVVSDHLQATDAAATRNGRGYPGDLTAEELETCLTFRDDLKESHPAFKAMVMAMHPYESEAFALCRFLRARDFDIEDVFTMLEEKEQIEHWTQAHHQDPNLFREFDNLNLVPEFCGCPLGVFLTQFPLLYRGIGKNGAIIVYLRAGKINCPGVECIVGDLSNALPFVWNRLYHGGRDAMAREISKLQQQQQQQQQRQQRNQSNNPIPMTPTPTVLAEKIIVIDLEGDSSLFSSGMSFMGVAPVAGGCFPETVNRTYILNAPFSFSLVWTVIKQALDPRTVAKIGFFSSIEKAKQDFYTYIDKSELLSDYGGRGPSFAQAMAQCQNDVAAQNHYNTNNTYTSFTKKGPTATVRYVVELLVMTGGSGGGWSLPGMISDPGFDFTLRKNEMVESIVVYSRSDNAVEISIHRHGKSPIIDQKIVSRTTATATATNADNNNNNNQKDNDTNNIAQNNYAVEIATSENFDSCTSSLTSFTLTTKNGIKGDNFLVAVTIRTGTAITLKSRRSSVQKTLIHQKTLTRAK